MSARQKNGPGLRTAKRIDIQPLTPERWGDFAKLFGKNGAVGGCWCMWFRESAADFRRNAGERNRRAMRAIVDEERVPGLLMYVGGEPAGWCSLAPREEFARLERSRPLARVDDQPVWSIVCFFIHREHRGVGVASALLRAAIAHATKRGARIVEGYAVDAEHRKITNSEAYTGPVSLFRAAGFEEVARRSPGRPIMRYYVAPLQPQPARRRRRSS